MNFRHLNASKRGFPFAGVTEIDAASEMNGMSSYRNDYRLLSWLSRIEYDYKDRYYVSGSFRTDGSLVFIRIIVGVNSGLWVHLGVFQMRNL